MARRRPSRAPTRANTTPTLRVIGGRWRSRRLPIADRPGLRPTPDRVRETLFNWLAPRIEGARCCDLFAGTGALGIEALSRGAASVDFFETDPMAARAITRALKTLEAGPAHAVHSGDACQATNRLAPASVDIAFLDPPFEANLHRAALTGLYGALRPDARVYLEYPIEQATDLGAVLAPDYTLLRQSSAAGVGFCLAAPAAHEPGSTT
ncbi:16S rRNA (guanine(966)-N(2))-methyltransferase RsmD [Salinisphaera sp. Q1T1-3]|uniref:16S rRNA (guanine(966)-N(2))-methyltransferase RsmD n=1 Tax=Salinisphaera sp. Q1T1-3 TaxID=2321229 RepID=UPI000E713135|nr:16S rRNA (guanine(966)-N(2))-methyltransferase RsmD [Salinisphaera sp. Q1T1-3]RJS93525.1 16S rRNA (guanine(966)-N(2))-methyltransferase RsmD [Salinisphaera sp. Q1T1-3]